MKVYARLIFAGLFGSAASPSVAGGTIAGTRIESTATASYTLDGVPHTITSNRLSLRVDEVIDAALSTLDAAPVPLVGQSAVTSFSLANIGNGPEAYRLSTVPVAGTTFAPLPLSIAVDTNGNGVFDTTSDLAILPNTPTPELAPDTSQRIFLVLGPSGSPTDGQSGSITLRAEAITATGTPGTMIPGSGASGGTAVIGRTGGAALANGTITVRNATVRMTKAYSVSDPFGSTEAQSGAFVTFTLNTEVVGTASASNLRITDPIPAGSRYIPASLKVNETPLTDAADADNGTVSTTAIEVNLGDQPSGARNTITFTVQLD